MVNLIFEKLLDIWAEKYYYDKVKLLIINIL